jgi:hypothetical protein
VTPPKAPAPRPVATKPTKAIVAAVFSALFYLAAALDNGGVTWTDVLLAVAAGVGTAFPVYGVTNKPRASAEVVPSDPPPPFGGPAHRPPTGA